MINIDARVDGRIPVGAKEKANKGLVVHGPSISSLIRMISSSVANDGLPRYWDIPNAETILSVNEAVDDLSKHKLKGASPYNELEKLLDEQGYPNQPF